MKDLVREGARAGYARIPAPDVDHDTLYHEIDDDFLEAPPIMLHAHVPGLLMPVWHVFRESVLAGPTDRVMRETVATEVSVVNACQFCVDVHGALAGPYDDSEIARWARATRTMGDPALDAPPFTDKDAPYVRGTALFFHYVNRMVSAFLTVHPTGNEDVPPGALDLIRGAIGVRNLDPTGTIVNAWAEFLAATQECGDHLPEVVRSDVGVRIDAWDGSDPPLGWRADIDDPAGRFALTVALAPSRVTDDLVAQVGAGDTDLVAMAAWAAGRATRRIATWV